MVHKKVFIQIIQIILILILFSCSNESIKEFKLWYKQPASNWNEELPIGNGRMGAMVFGGIDQERLQLNENTLYSGKPSQSYNRVKTTKPMITY
jgi:alpha-L-fucosidase 2